MTYADYSYYADTYKGTMSEADFTRLARQASAYLDSITLGRTALVVAGDMLNKVQDACCAVTDELYKTEQGGEVSSVNNDGYSVSYAASGRTPARRKYEAAALYLSGTGLLSAGV